jgi:hypothetical protein
LLNRRQLLALIPASMAAQSRPSNLHPAVSAPVTSGRIQPVLTRSGGNLRQQTYLNETILSPASIRANPPRKLFSMVMPGDLRGCEAQPLLVPSVAIADGSVHDLCICCTMSNNVWCFDANDGTPLWMVRPGRPITNSSAIDGYSINDHWGILSTGVIDAATLYVVSWTSPDGTEANASFHLNALNVKDGSTALPALLIPQSGGLQRKQRASLTLTNVAGRKTIFIPFGTIAEEDKNAHGYITAVDLASWKITTEWNVTAAGSGGGIWQSGQGLIADDAGNLWLSTSNGDFDGLKNFGECFIQISYNGTSITPVQWWTPWTDGQRGGAAQGWTDMDLGSAAPAVIPALNLAVVCGKDGIAYVVPLTGLGQMGVSALAGGANYGKLLSPAIWYTYYNPANPAPVNPADLNFNYANRTHNSHSGSISFLTDTGWQLYCGGENGNVRAWSIDATGKLKFLANGAEQSSAQSPVPLGGMPGFALALSANGTKNGIVWATNPDFNANTQVTTGRLLAYDATQFGKYSDGTGSMPLLWSSPSYVFNKFAPVVVSGGKVYVASYDGRIDVWG